jgi:CheY-like chemotaxis protein
VLEDWGCHVLTASSGAEALRKLGDHIRAPDVIVSDYRLREGETGIEVIRHVQAQLDVRIPSILVTGDFNPARIDEAAASGMQLLHKPVPAATLRNSLQQALAPTNASY